MTNERAVEILNLDLDILGQYGGETAEAYKMAIQALEAQPCEDCISRAYLLNHDFIITAQNGISHRVIYATRVEEAPSVTPQRPKGKWIEYCGGLQCSECGWEVDDEYYLGQRVACPNCGSYNGGKKE